MIQFEVSQFSLKMKLDLEALERANSAWKNSKDRFIVIEEQLGKQGKFAQLS